VVVEAWLDPDSSARTRELLDAVPRWEMHADRWDRAAALLVEVAEALADRDRIALQAALDALESAGPAKATRIGTTPVVPAPEPVLDRVAALVYRIGPAAPVDETLTAQNGPQA
jgi:hypothetical protein